jgi:prefoldin subunit 5
LVVSDKDTAIALLKTEMDELKSKINDLNEQLRKKSNTLRETEADLERERKSKREFEKMYKDTKKTLDEV